jgi:DNA-binding NarL/FixJ family response regulator
MSLLNDKVIVFDPYVTEDGRFIAECTKDALCDIGFTNVQWMSDYGVFLFCRIMISRYRLIIMDIWVPTEGMPGFRYDSRIVRSVKMFAPHSKIIVFSALSNNIKSALSAGADGFIQKPRLWELEEWAKFYGAGAPALG